MSAMKGKVGPEKQLAEKLATPRQRVAELQELVTKHERTEDASLQRDEHYRVLIETLFDMVCEIDSNGRMLYLSPNHLQIVGFDPRERLGQSVFENIHPDDLPQIQREFSQSMEQAFGQAVYRHKSKNGEWRWLETRGRLYETQDGTQRAVLVTRDVTERRQAEEALRLSHEELERRVEERTAEIRRANERLQAAVAHLELAKGALQESEARYRSLFEHNPDGVYSLDLQGYFLNANLACCRICGYSLGEFLKRSFVFLMVPEDLSRTLDHFRRAAEGEPQNYEVAILRKDGARVDLNVTNVPMIKDGKVIGVYGVAKDITERIRAEVALRRSEESAKRLAKENAVIAEIGRIISSSSNIEDIYEDFTKEVRKLIPFERVAINIIDAKSGTLAFPYVAGSEVPGRKREEVIPLAGTAAEWVLQNQLSLVVREENSREKVAPFPSLLPIFRAGFKTFMTVPLMSWGRVFGILSFVTIRPDAYGEDYLKLAEKVGNQISGVIHNAQLFLESKQAENELNKSREQLRSLAAHLQSVREEDRTHIARWIHDELGQALTRIGIDLSLLVANSPKKKQSLKERIESISKFVGETMELVRKMSIELRPPILNFGLVAALAWQAQDFQDRTGIRCEFQANLENVDLPGEHLTAVFRIYQEILTNAVRHAKASRVDARLRKTANGIILEVKDNGKGISHSEISNPKALGLLGMRERALLFGGELDFIGRPGKGTTVVVRIPLKRDK